MFKVVLFISLFSIYLNATSTAWRIPMVATIGTVFATNILKCKESGITVGISDKITLIKANFNWLGKKSIYEIKNFKLNYYTRFSYGIWKESLNSSKVANNTFDLNPVFRVESDNLFLEYSTGVSYITNYKFDKSNINLGGHFQFNHFLNTGVKFKRIVASVGFGHYSNNNIFKINNGINFIYFNISYRY